MLAETDFLSSACLWWVNRCGATSGPEASRPTPGRSLLFVLHIPLLTPGQADWSMQTDGLIKQNGRADRTCCTRVQNGNMIKNRLVFRLAGHDVELGAPSKMAHYRRVHTDPGILVGSCERSKRGDELRSQVEFAFTIGIGFFRP